MCSIVYMRLPQMCNQYKINKLLSCDDHAGVVYMHMALFRVCLDGDARAGQNPSHTRNNAICIFSHDLNFCVHNICFMVVTKRQSVGWADPTTVLNMG